MNQSQNKNKFIKFAWLFSLTILKNLFTKILVIFNPLIYFFVMGWQKTRFLRSLFSFSQCRFYPSCSDYFYQALKIRGLILGSILTVKRLLKCHPLCEGGIDEVPAYTEQNTFLRSCKFKALSGSPGKAGRAKGVGRRKPQLVCGIKNGF